MKILVLGGTRFVGKAIVQEALNADHEVTLFTRGQSNAALFPNVEKLAGNRDGGLDSLKGRSWDAVIDTSGYLPRLVRDSARLLAGVVERYTFISTISTYASFANAGIDENSPQAVMQDTSIETVTDETYGPLKTLCETAVCEEMNGRALLVRPTLIIGPYEEDDLIPYWVHRVARGGELLVPGSAASPMQFIDARDLGKWVVKATVTGLSGPYITTGPDYPLTMGAILQTCKQVCQSDTTFTYVGDQFLFNQGLQINSETPWWIPGSHIGYGMFNNQKAIAVGLTFRPLAETIRDTLEWLDTRPADYEWRSGLSPEQEQKLLRRYKEQVSRPDPVPDIQTTQNPRVSYVPTDPGSTNQRRHP